MAAPRLCVIGAGPIGLEAALRGQRKGWEVTVLEAGEVGAHLKRWGHIQFFTPLGMNISPLALEVLGAAAPPLDGLLTGKAHAEQILEPLATQLNVRTQHRVRSISRHRLGRNELAGHPLRAKRPFELLIEGPEGEFLMQADGIIDASGVFAQARWSGRGGNPVPGERQRDRQIWRHLPDMKADPGWKEAAVVVMGNGHSAATALCLLAEQRQQGGGPVAWLVPDDRQRPIDTVAQDPLPARAQVVDTANLLAAKPPKWLTVYRRAEVVDARQPELSVLTRTGLQNIPCDRWLSLCGYRPDSEWLAELAIAQDPAFEGGQGLAVALAKVTDCLAKVDVQAADLASGEADFFLCGHRSYGRRNTFLLQTGIAQLDIIFESWKLTRK